MNELDRPPAESQPPQNGAFRGAAFSRKWSIVAPICLVAGCFQFYALVALDYTTALVSSASWEDVSEPPRPNFRLDSVEWPVSTYAVSPDLEPFRQEFRKRCTGQLGLTAALCVSNSLAERFPNGAPSTEFVNRTFDPLSHLRGHLDGEPGHCLNRSAIVVAELLAVGIPSRVLQLVPADGEKGHTLVEVWEQDRGWLLVDPTFGGMVGDQARPEPLRYLVNTPGVVRWFPEGVPPKSSSEPDAKYLGTLYSRLVEACVVYPEPWLYLRVGEKSAPWPFRGTFVHIGPRELKMGPAQLVLRVGVLLCGIVILTGIISTGWRLTRKRRQ